MNQSCSERRFGSGRSQENSRMAILESFQCSLKICDAHLVHESSHASGSPRNFRIHLRSFSMLQNFPSLLGPLRLRAPAQLSLPTSVALLFSHVAPPLTLLQEYCHTHIHMGYVCHTEAASKFSLKAADPPRSQHRRTSSSVQVAVPHAIAWLSGRFVHPPRCTGRGAKLGLFGFLAFFPQFCSVFLGNQ